MKKIITLTLAFSLAFLSSVVLTKEGALQAQNIAITDDAGYTADPSAMLDIKSTTKGMLVPRVTTIQRNAISNPVKGLLVFDTDLDNFYFYDASAWINLSSGNPSGLWGQSGNMIFLNDTTYNLGIGTHTPGGKLEVKADGANAMSDPIFGVINYNGDTVFAVYPQGVRIQVADDTTTSKAVASKSGFAIGGFSLTKGATEEYMRVTSDSVRIYIDDEGGSKGSASKGGFAIGGFSLTKTLPQDYFNISGASDPEVINPAEARIVWYPAKEALLSGKVLIESIDSIGQNSWATGNESKSIGDYSQALGYHARAFGNNSTAIGYYAESIGPNSYAFGNYSTAADSASYAIGSGAKASGLRSFVLGSTGIDSAGIATSPTIASGDYSYAFGMGSQALGLGSFSIGTQDTASGDYSTAMGYKTNAEGQYSFSIGKNTTASGKYSFATGLISTASGDYSTAIGYNSVADGANSIAMGWSAEANGAYSLAIGAGALADNHDAIALGDNARAFGINSFAIGYICKAKGVHSYSMGYNTVSNANFSYAMGSWTIANGDYSMAMGDRTNAKSYNSYVIGRYNDTTGTTNSWIETEPLFIIGNGSSDALRSNAMTVLKNGNVGIGTIAPDAKLDIANPAAGVVTLKLGRVASTPTIQARDDAGGGWLIMDGSSTTGSVGINNYSSGDVILANGGGNVGINTTSFGNGTKVLALENGVAPTASSVNGVLLYADNADAELKVRDELGNITTLSPHNFSNVKKSEPMAWSYYSESANLKQIINVDMLKTIRLVEKLSGEKLVHIVDLNDNEISTDETVGKSVLELVKEQQAIIEELRKKVEKLESSIADAGK